MELREEKVLDAVMLEGLALLAAVNDRSIVEELNRAVEVYLRRELASAAEALSLEEHILDKTEAR